MNRRCATVAGLLLVSFGGLLVVLQLQNLSSERLGRGSIIRSCFRANYFARISDIVARGGGMPRRLDMVLPEHTRLFMTGMSGTTNGGRLGYYYNLTYYLFPREVAVTLDQPRFTVTGFQGRGTESNAELRTNGFDVRLDVADDGRISVIGLHVLPLKDPANPIWFGSWADPIRAFLLPLLTSLSGVWLLRFWFGGGLTARMPMAEQLACGLGLGMMAVAALTLGIKLCGCHGYGWVLVLTAAGSVAALWRDRRLFGNGRPAVFGNWPPSRLPPPFWRWGWWFF